MTVFSRCVSVVVDVVLVTSLPVLAAPWELCDDMVPLESCEEESTTVPVPEEDDEPLSVDITC